MYLKTWKQLASMSFSTTLSNRIDSLSYLGGKILRFIFFFIFILSLFRFVDTVGGYTKYETLLFFLTFNLIDVGSQLLLRGIYMLRSEVKKGNFDMVLVKPTNPLFLIFSRLIDFLDLIFIIPIIGLLLYTISQLDIHLTILTIFLYLLFFTLSSILVLAIHIITAAVTVYTMESDNVLWLYREAMTIGRFPPSIYASGIQQFFTYFIPIIIIVAYPTQLLLGEITLKHATLACIFTLCFFICSLFVWQLSLQKYSSASS